MKKLINVCLILASVFVYAQHVSYDEKFPLENYNFILGTQAIGGKYKFTHDSALLEQAKHVRALGSNILKVSLGPKAPETYNLGNVKVNSTLELFKAFPDYKKTFDMDFKYIFFWMHTLTDVKWKRSFTAKDEKKIYDEMFEFTQFLLKEYNNSGKTFMIGNWEGDWLLHTNYDRNMTPPAEHVENMTKWFQVRQRAVEDAKNKTKHENVFVYHYIELNLVLKGMQGKTCIANDILPNVDVDFISYSSYEATKNRSFDEKKQTLIEVFDYLEKQLKPKDGLPFARRVFIGEYGYHANINNPKSFDKQLNETNEIMQISLELNIPFALHWQMYNNEYDKNGVSKQMSLINEQGIKMPLYYVHQNYYKKMNAYLKEYKEKNKSYPKQEDFNAMALEILKTL